jgi:hypothetical protein
MRTPGAGACWQLAISRVADSLVGPLGVNARVAPYGCCAVKEESLKPIALLERCSQCLGRTGPPAGTVNLEPDGGLSAAKAGTIQRSWVEYSNATTCPNG